MARKRRIRRRKRAPLAEIGRVVRRRRRTRRAPVAKRRRRTYRRRSAMAEMGRVVRRRRRSRKHVARRSSRRRGLRGTPFFGLGSRFFGAFNPKAAFQRIFAKDTLKGVGAASIGFIIGKVASGIIARSLKPSNELTPQVIGSLIGAASGAMVGSIVWKSERVADCAATANLLVGLNVLVGDRLNKLLKSMGLGYSDGMGQVYLPEEVKMMGLSSYDVGSMAQLYVPERTAIAGPAVYEEDLMGNEGEFAFGGDGGPF